MAVLLLEDPFTAVGVEVGVGPLLTPLLGGFIEQALMNSDMVNTANVNRCSAVDFFITTSNEFESKIVRSLATGTPFPKIEAFWGKGLLHLTIDFRYNSSTLFLAQGVRRKNFRLDLMLGSL
jgi:hypothetical protein